MTDKQVHIVSFNIPFPPNYGGVIDVYYKIKSLHECGVKVHLHCFQYGREETEELMKICHTVNYYPRKKFFQAFYHSVPFIIASRKSNELLSNLSELVAPIIFEGLHTCFYLSHPSLSEHTKAVRIHNIEWDYYRGLGKAERNFFRKFYFYSESKKLKEFEPELNTADLILTISRHDDEYYGKIFKTNFYTPAFHSNEAVRSKEGRGKYALYHGSLNVVENNQAAIYLLRKVFDKLDIPLIIAGKNPLSTLKSAVKAGKNVRLIESPSDEKLMDLITNAHVNVLPTFQATGIKLKLLNALFNGRYCLTNSRMVQNTGLEKLCIVENDSTKMKEVIRKLFQVDFCNQKTEERKKILQKEFTNKVNAEQLISRLFPSPQ